MISTVGKERLWEILKEDYGITTEDELDKALEEMGGIDISVFRIEFKKEKGEIA